MCSLQEAASSNLPYSVFNRGQCSSLCSLNTLTEAHTFWSSQANLKPAGRELRGKKVWKSLLMHFGNLKSHAVSNTKLMSLMEATFKPPNTSFEHAFEGSTEKNMEKESVLSGFPYFFIIKKDRSDEHTSFAIRTRHSGGCAHCAADVITFIVCRHSACKRLTGRTLSGHPHRQFNMKESIMRGPAC